MPPEPAGHPATLAALALFTLASLGLGVLANITARRGTFLKKYFLGNRSLGPIAVALTAAVMSGGTFIGVPSYIYTFGWAVALWICSYMIAGVVVLGGAGKRIGQLARKTGAITLPDLLRERYGSAGLGLLCSLLMMLFLTANLVSQFKAGGVILKQVLPADWAQIGPLAGAGDPLYVLGLTVFAATVLAYTVYGGFLAAIWTDIFQSLIMAVGVVILLPLALAASGGLEAGTAAGIAQAGPGYDALPGAGRAFVTLGLAFSFFVMWPIAGLGQPSTAVRLMAFRSSNTLRTAIVWLTFYNAIIYIPIVLIFICARAILPDLTATATDEVMPRLVVHLANPWLAGLILAAPYGAVMSTVSGFLLIIASGLVRDVYQRWINPRASERTLARASYLATLGVGIAAAALALNPPQYLQLIIVFSGTGMAASFLTPMLMGCYWRRATAAGATAAMVTGAATTLVLYAAGMLLQARGFEPMIGPKSKVTPYYLLGCDPCVWSLLASAVAGVVVSLLTRPPDPARVNPLFDRAESSS